MAVQPPPPGNRGIVARHLRCRAAPGTAPGFTDEMSGLLRRRLRLAILIILAGFVLHTLRALWLGGFTFDEPPGGPLLGLCEIALMGLVSAILWSRRPLTMWSLRLLEVITFGALAAAFAVIQVRTCHDGALLRALVPGHEPMVFRLVGLSSGLGWFVLIVLYGVFIPNTARRCAAVVGGLAALPVTLVVADALLDRTTGPYVLSGLPELLILMAMATSIAIFGSHKMRELQKKAHEAERIGQYRLKQVLGFGGMGTVYLAEHMLLRRPCAIKVIRPDQAGDPKTLKRFEREVQATATLTHWNSVEIFDYGHTDDGRFYYVMEYLPGMNLEDMIERYGPMPPARAGHLLRQVCHALREAHATGLIHRDIKPSNIIACERGKVYDVAKLLDFGLVKSTGLEGSSVKLTMDGGVAGSPAFISPEQARGWDVDARSDIYNVGAVAYYLVTGELPFDRLSSLEMLHAHAFEPFEPRPGFTESVPADLQRIIVRCLKKDPALRYADVAALESALGACACAGDWAPDQAEEWWQQHGDGTAVPQAPAVPPPPEETVLVDP
jgi:serine/threonine-protein kinase